MLICIILRRIAIVLPFAVAIFDPARALVLSVQLRSYLMGSNTGPIDANRIDIFITLLKLTDI